MYEAKVTNIDTREVLATYFVAEENFDKFTDWVFENYNPYHVCVESKLLPTWEVRE